VAFEFYLKPIYYDNDFAFYVGDSRVDEQRTLRYTADTPMKAYAKFVEATTIHSFYGKYDSASTHVASFRELFYSELQDVIKSKGKSDNDTVLDIVFEADGCFDYCYGGNQEIEFGIRKVYEFNINSQEEFDTAHRQMLEARAQYIEKMTADYDSDTFMPGLEALEIASKPFGSQEGLKTKRALKAALESSRALTYKTRK
jgi:hypothetical protein